MEFWASVQPTLVSLWKTTLASSEHYMKLVWSMTQSPLSRSMVKRSSRRWCLESCPLSSSRMARQACSLQWLTNLNGGQWRSTKLHTETSSSMMVNQVQLQVHTPSWTQVLPYSVSHILITWVSRNRYSPSTRSFATMVLIAILLRTPATTTGNTWKISYSPSMASRTLSVFLLGPTPSLETTSIQQPVRSRSHTSPKWKRLIVSRFSEIPSYASTSLLSTTQTIRWSLEWMWTDLCRPTLTRLVNTSGWQFVSWLSLGW